MTVATPPPADLAAQDSASSSSTPLILVVDDDSDTRAIIKQSLVAMGWRVEEAKDGIEAQERLSPRLPDLIVLDVMMPRMTGLEFIEWFRETSSPPAAPFVPVLMLSALSEVEQKFKGISSGADDYIAKPFHYRELQARAQALLRIRALTNDLYRRQLELLELNTKLSETQAALVARERELAVVQLAGAAAHNMGQPLTTVLLHCRLLMKGLESARIGCGEQKPAALEAAIGESLKSVTAIQSECEGMRSLLSRLKDADQSAVSGYVGEHSILDLSAVREAGK